MQEREVMVTDHGIDQTGELPCGVVNHSYDINGLDGLSRPTFGGHYKMLTKHQYTTGLTCYPQEVCGKHSHTFLALHADGPPNAHL